jgi:hypothetical protein
MLTIPGAALVKEVITELLTVQSLYDFAPGEGFHRLLRVEIEFQADATVANRIVQIRYREMNVDVYLHDCPNIVASTTKRFVLAPGLTTNPDDVDSIGDTYFISIPRNLTLDNSDLDFGVTCYNGQAGDLVAITAWYQSETVPEPAGASPSSCSF